jgi:hypothetical protein
LEVSKGSRPTEDYTNWTRTGAVYFVFTVVTTIGYGTFLPATDGGTAFTVFICIAGVGSFAYFVERCSWAFHKMVGAVSSRLGLSQAKQIYFISSSGAGKRVMRAARSGQTS